MSDRTITARLILEGQDKGASASVAAVVKSVRQLEEVSKVSKPLQDLAKDFQHVEQASKAVDAAMKARSGLAAAEAGLKATTGAAEAAAKALDQARVARTAFDGVKAAKGSEQAKQIEAATKAVRDYTAAQRKAEGDVRKATAAVAAQAATLRHAETSAKGLGADLGNLEAHQQRLRASTEGATDAMRRQIRVEDRAAKAAAHHAKEEVEFARHRRMHGLVGAGAAVASGAVGIHGVGHVIAHGAQAGAEVQTERVKLEAINVPAAERSHIEARALDLAAQYKNVTQASVMELWKEMRSVMTDPHEVDHVIDPMVRAKSILDAQDKTGTASHGLNLLVKGAESIGAAKDPERFTHLLDGYIKAMQVMGKTITPEGIYEMQKYSKAAGARWSDRFILTTAQSLGQEMGGSTAGNSIQMAQKQIVGGMQNLHSKAREFAAIGLIDEKNLDVLKTGEVKGVKRGVKHAVQGDDLAATDLDKWVYTVLLPALDAHGVKAEGDQLAWVQKNFTGTAGDVVSKLITQRESFQAHEKMYGTSSGLAGQAHNRDDATAALGGVSKSLETFLGVVTSPVMKDAANILDSIAGGIGLFSVRLDAFNKAHPDIAKAEGPAAAVAGVAGAGLTSALVYKALSSGFGLKTSAVALDGAAAGHGRAAIALTEAAVALGAKGAAPTEIAKDAVKAAPLVIGGVVASVVAGGAAASLVGKNAVENKGFADPYLENPMLGADPAGYGIGAGIVHAPEMAAAIEKRRVELKELDRETRRAREMQRRDAGIPYALPPRAAPPMLNAEVGSGDPDFVRETRRGFEMIRRDSATAGREAGEKAGEGIRSGIQTKAPEVVEQGQTLYDRLKAIFANGIMIPMQMSFGGEGVGGGSGIQNASFGGGGGFGGMIRKASLGGGSGGASFGGVSGGGSDIGGGVGGGVVGPTRGISASDLRGINPEMAAYIRASALSQGIDPSVALRIANSEGLRGSVPGVRNTPGDKGTSFGPFQLHYASRIPGLTLGGLGDRYTRETGHHASDPKHWKEQIDFALRTARREGWGAWHGRYGAGIGTRDGIGSVRPVPMQKAEAAALEPHLVRGLDGKEGLDLGDGTMKMPNGAIRSITKSGLEIPDPPAGGFGEGGRRGGMDRAAERMHDAVDRMEGMGFHGQISLAVTGSGRERVRATALRVRGRGGMSADMGVTEPGVEQDAGDWL